jgi:hypothetical protein
MQDVMAFASQLLALGDAPTAVDQAIAKKRAWGGFLATLGNERARPVLRELQQEKFRIVSEQWVDNDSWKDLIGKLEMLRVGRPDVHVAWEPYSPNHEDPRQRSFRCFIQHADQRQWMVESGGIDVMFLDSTHGTNNYGMQLFIGATQHKQLSIALPLFFFMCTVDKDVKYQQQNGLEWMMYQLYACCPDLSPGAILMDHDVSEHNAVAAVLMARASVGVAKLLAVLLEGGVEVDAPVPVSLPQGGQAEGCLYVDAIEAIALHASAHTVGDRELADMLLAKHIPAVLPAKPSSAEYTAVLVGDLQHLQSALASLQVRMSEHKSQDSAWASYVDLCQAMVNRHGSHSLTNMHQADDGLVDAFLRKYLRTVKLLCEFHTKKSWTEQLNGYVKDDSDRKALYTGVVGIMKNAKNWGLFASAVEAFVVSWSGKYPELVNYFCTRYFCKEWRQHWAAAGRMFRHQEADTTLPLERINGILKYVQMKGVVTIRPGTLLVMLVGSPSSHGSEQDNLVEFYARRLADAKSAGVDHGRMRAYQQQTRDKLASLKFDYTTGAKVCELTDECMCTWSVLEGTTWYMCCPRTTYCECSIERPSHAAVCAHLQLVDYVRKQDAGKAHMAVASGLGVQCIAAAMAPATGTVGYSVASIDGDGDGPAMADGSHDECLTTADDVSGEGLRPFKELVAHLVDKVHLLPAASATALRQLADSMMPQLRVLQKSMVTEKPPVDPGAQRGRYADHSNRALGYAHVTAKPPMKASGRGKRKEVSRASIDLLRRNGAVATGGSVAATAAAAEIEAVRLSALADADEVDGVAVAVAGAATGAVAAAAAAATASAAHN